MPFLKETSFSILVLKGPYQYWAFPYFPFSVLFEPFLWISFLLGYFPVLLFQFFDFSVCSLQCWIILLLCISFSQSFCLKLVPLVDGWDSITSNWSLYSSLLWHFRKYFSLPFWRSWVCLSADNSVIPGIYFTRFRLNCSGFLSFCLYLHFFCFSAFVSAILKPDK